MPDSAPATTPAEVASPTDFVDKLQLMLNKLVPGETVTVRLASGEALDLSTALPARRQIRAFRLIRDLLEDEDVQAKFKSFGAGSVEQVVNVVLDLATDESVAERLAGIFSAAYPDAVDGDPLDLLPLEEMVTAIVPFTARFAKSLGTGMASLLGVAETAEA